MSINKFLSLCAVLFSSQFSFGQLIVKANMKHINPSTNVFTGSILLTPSGGTAPYSYTWYQGINPYLQNRENVQAGLYSLKVKSSANDSAYYTYDLGYKLNWSVLNGTLSRNDSLLLYETQSGQYRTALSSNILRPDKEGWLEYVISPLNQPYVIGLAYNSTEATKGTINDIEFALHVSTGNSLYCWSFGYFTFLGYVSTGDVLKIERSGGMYFLKRNGAVIITKPADMSRMLRVKAQINAKILVGIGTSFADSTGIGSLNNKASIQHLSMDGLLPGKIISKVSGGNSPYTYDWNPPISNSNTFEFYNPASVALLVRDYDNTAVSRSYNVGYRTDWTNFHTSISRNDSLIPTPDRSGNSSAFSINKLKANANGWIELVINAYSSPYLVGFTDGTHTPDPSGHSDVDYAFHLSTGNTLFAYSNGVFYPLGTANRGDVIRIARNNSGFYLAKNNTVLHSQTSSNRKEMRIKALLEEKNLFNLGCNFTLPLAVDFIKNDLNSKEELNSGSIFLTPKYGRQPYRYTWNTDATSSSITDIGKGFYSVIVTDSLKDTVKLSFLIGQDSKLVNLKNIYRNNAGEFVKDNSNNPSSANTNYYLPAGSNSGYGFLIHDVNTNFGFALNPFDTSGGLSAQVPMKVKQSIVSIARNQLPAVGSADYAKINFADDITTGDYANVIQKEFFQVNCDGCVRSNVSGFQVNYGEVFSLYNGVTIKKGEPITNDTYLQAEIKNNVLTFSKNDAVFFSSTFENGVNFIGSISLNAPLMALSSGGTGGTKPTGVVSIGSSNSNPPEANEGCGVCSTDLSRNYAQITSFDELGNIVGQSKEYTDNLGRTIQMQIKNVSANTILATQLMYDARGRAVGSTLTAPINSSCFCFKTDFMKNPSNTEYTYNDFDLPNYSTNGSTIAQGETDNPKALANTVQGTLGWYYSNNNTFEKYTPIANTPYSRIQYSHTDASSSLRSAKPGYQLSTGNGHEVYNFKMNSMGELNYVFGTNRYWRVDDFINFYGNNQCDEQIIPCPLMNTAPLSMKSISVDENGIESVQFLDLTGNVIAKCLSGKVNGANVKTQTVSQFLSFVDETQRYIDVHIPSGCENSLSFSSSQNCPPAFNMSSGQPSYNILNLKTGRFLVFSGSIDYTGTQPTLPAGYYRIMVKNRPWCIGGVTVTQRLNYYSFSLYYYDYANRLKAVVSPKGFDNAYLPTTNINYHNSNKIITTVSSDDNHPQNFPEGKTWTLEPDGKFENTIPLAIADNSGHSDQNINLKVTLGTIFAASAGEDPDHPSEDERTNENTTAYGDYTSRIYITDTTGMASTPDSSFYTARTVNYRVTVALINDKGAVMENTIQQNFLKCVVLQNGELQKTVWSPVIFTYNIQNRNTGEGSVESNVKSFKLIALEPVDPSLGESLSQYESLVNGLKMTVGLSSTNGNTHPVHTMVERYQYNSWDQMQVKISPDEGETDYVYSKDGKLRYMQNEKQNASTSNSYFKKFSYVDYDDMNRVITKGEFAPPLSGVPTQALSTVINKYVYFDNYDERYATASPSNYISIHDRTEVAFSESSYLHNGPVLANNSTDKSYVVYDTYDPQFWTQTALNSNTYRQHHLINKISYSYNENKKTWYSYDEEGRIEWVAQKYYGVNAPGVAADVVKTFKYKYDFFGNITETIYNEETNTDRIQHYYEYDQDKNLKRVYTSRPVAGTPVTYPKVLQAKYDYYLHGPLKRVELGDKLQGIDYVYTINGWLKTVNGPEMQEKYDPGVDGYLKSGTSNTAYKDLFGYALEYFLKDYQRSGTNVQTFNDAQYATPIAPDLFNGTIKAQRWQTNTPSGYIGIAYQNQQLIYAYKYDKKYQLTEANMATVYSNGIENDPVLANGNQLSASITTDYRIFDLSYDNNGNILTLKRNAYTAGTGGLNMDNLTYNYVSCSNKLFSVSDAVATNPYTTFGFKPGQSSTNYGYFAGGQLGTDLSNNKLYEYNSEGNITAIKTTANTLVAEYKYDERGNRIEKIVSLPGGMKKYTLYIRDVEGKIVTAFDKTASGNTTNFSIPSEWNIYSSSRLGILDNTAGVESYIYELNDHLGNARATFKKQAKTVISHNFNSNATTNDDNWFHNNYANVTNAFDVNLNFPSTNYFIRTQKLSKPYGAGTKRIPVKTGNSISISWKSLYEAGTVPTAGMVATLTDENGNPYPGAANYQYYAINGSLNTWNSQQVTFNVSSAYPNMYLTVYPWNNDASNRVAFFDDITITFNSGSVFKPDLLNMADYYPHGSVMPGMNYNSSYKYKYGYQGQFAEMDDESNENFFELRNYNPLLGRFYSPDPLGQYFSPYMAMGNNHPNSIDPDGGQSYDDVHYNSKTGESVIVSTCDYFDRVYYDGELLTYASQGWGKTYLPASGVGRYTSNANTTPDKLSSLNVLSNKAWITQAPNWTACFATSKKIVESSGVKNAAPKNLKIQMTVENSKHNALDVSSTAGDGLNAINESLDRNEPIVVGVNHHFGNTYNEGTTDHFIVVMGRGYQGSRLYYRFFDVGTTRIAAGTHEQNRLYLTNKKTLVGTTQYNQSNYTVSQVRPNR